MAELYTPSSSSSSSPPPPPPSSSLSPSNSHTDRINEWIACAPLGQGSFASVSLALELRTNKLFAAKSTPICYPPSPELLALLNEAQILRSLSNHSPFIIPFMGTSECSSIQSPSSHGRSFNLFLQFMDSGSLHDLIKREGGKLSEVRVRPIASSILRGLEYLHANNIVHCDIKSHNILVNSKGEVKIADFGASQRISIIRETENPKFGSKSCPIYRGTPLWMAPEVVSGTQQGPPSDIWSFGCTLVEMLQGRPPYGHISDLGAALFKIASSSSSFPPLPPCISAQAHDFLLRCLHPDPSLRWTASQLLNHPFIHNQTLNGSAQFDLLHSETSIECNQSSPRSTLRFDDCMAASSTSSDSLLMSSSLGVDESSTSSSLTSVGVTETEHRDDVSSVQTVDNEGVHAMMGSNVWITVRTADGWSEERDVEPFMMTHANLEHSRIQIAVGKGLEVSLDSAAFLQSRSSGRRRRIRGDGGRVSQD